MQNVHSKGYLKKYSLKMCILSECLQMRLDLGTITSAQVLLSFLMQKGRNPTVPFPSSLSVKDEKEGISGCCC